jgi:hypothetical protein
MPEELSPAQKAARTRKLRAIERETQQKHLNAFAKARASEAASKEALRVYCEKHKWRVAFFEGATGSPRTGIIDAIIFRIAKGNADVLDLRLVQLKGGKAGITAAEIARLRKAPTNVLTDWMIAAFDGESLQVIPEDLNAARTIQPASPETIAKRSDAAKRAWITIRANRTKRSVKS